ncbi:MAG: cytochrome c [Pseudomonadota bacterium]
MRRGEKAVIAIMVAVVTIGIARNAWNNYTHPVVDRGIPYYTTASPALERAAMDVYRQENCKQCHSLWTVRSLLDNVPAPILDGLGSLHTEEWFYQYLSAKDPQAIQPSRLKKQWRMPSYADLPEEKRKLLAQYLASLKVQDWYLDETRKAREEKLTGVTSDHE